MMNRGLSGVGKRVKYLRNKSRISQEALAESFGLGYRTAISDYESEKRAIPIDIVKLYSEKFGVSTDWIIGVTRVKTPEISEDALEMLQAYGRIVLPEQKRIAIKQVKLLGAS